MPHRCGRRLTRTDAIAGVCQRCGDLLKPAEISAALNQEKNRA